MLNLQDHRTMQRAPLTGAIASGVGGAGLGGLFAALSGANPVLGALGGGALGALGGGLVGNNLRNTYNNAITDQEALQLAQQLDAESGTNSFTQALASDPQGFKQNIASMYGGINYGT